MKIQHVRVARSTNRLDEITAFYRDVLGLEVLSRFDDHDGFDGVMLGHSGDSMHFEFTRQHSMIVEERPSPEDLVILYFDEGEWGAAERSIATAGATVVTSNNPYWDRHGITVEDPDGHRVVLHRGPWRSSRSTTEAPVK